MSYQTPTPLRVLVSQLKKNGSRSDKTTSVQSLSLRIPTYDYATIEAIAQHSGVSRNKIVGQLIELALTEVFSALDDDTSSALNDLRHKIYTNIVEPHLSGREQLPQSQQGEL
jgi:hypothetical protein